MYNVQCDHHDQSINATCRNGQLGYTAAAANQNKKTEDGKKVARTSCVVVAMASRRVE